MCFHEGGGEDETLLLIWDNASEQWDYNPAAGEETQSEYLTVRIELFTKQLHEISELRHLRGKTTPFQTTWNGSYEDDWNAPGRRSTSQSILRTTTRPQSLEILKSV